MAAEGEMIQIGSAAEERELDDAVHSKEPFHPNGFVGKQHPFHNGMEEKKNATSAFLKRHNGH